jgi:hypothetical protein
MAGVSPPRPSTANTTKPLTLMVGLLVVALILALVALIVGAADL